jgi:hypothetical protein
MDTANTYLVARVWSEVARWAAPDGFEPEDGSHASLHRLLTAAAEHLEWLLERVFADAGTVKAELQSRFDDDERDVVWALLEDPGAFGAVTADGLSEVLVAGIISYAARVQAFYLLGVPIPTRDGPPMLADVVARRLSSTLDEWATEDAYGPPGPQRLERALAELVGSSPMERAAVGMVVPEIYEVLTTLRDRRRT